MKITSIKQQLKRADRCSIYIDEQYAFSLSQNGLLESKLAVGDEISDKELADYQRKSEEGKLYDRLLNLLSIRPRSEWELRSYLKRKKTDPQLSHELIERLRAKGYVDDKDFARRWVESRRLLKPTSRRKLWQELKTKNIAEEIIAEVLAEDETEETQVIRELIAKKRKQIKYHDEQKLMQFLARQGFNYGDIKEALSSERE